jgi:hypothetical protein
MSEVSPSRQAPFWHHTHSGEQRWPVTAVVFVVIVLQVTLPRSLNIKFPLIICGIEFLVLLLITAMNPKRISEHLPTPRTLALLLAALMTI